MRGFSLCGFGLLGLLLCACQPPVWSGVVTLDRSLLSVALPSDNAAFVVGGDLGSGGAGVFLRYDGSVWHRTSTSSTITLWWVHALSPTNAWAVGENGTIVHWDGIALLEEQKLTDRTLYGIWGTSNDDLWAVGGKPGSDGILLHKTAVGWTVEPSPVPFVSFFKIWGAAANDIFVCGEGGTIVHYDGTTWAPQPSGQPQSTTLFTVAGRNGSEVYAVGGLGRGVVLRYDGQSWTPLGDPALTQIGALTGVAVDSDGSLVIVGASGTKLHGQPGALVNDTFDLPRDDLHAAAIRSGELFAVGGNYISPAGVTRSGVIAHRGRSLSSTVAP